MAINIELYLRRSGATNTSRNMYPSTDIQRFRTDIGSAMDGELTPSKPTALAAERTGATEKLDVQTGRFLSTGVNPKLQALPRQQNVARNLNGHAPREAVHLKYDSRPPARTVTTPVMDACSISLPLRRPPRTIIYSAVAGDTGISHAV